MTKDHKTQSPIYLPTIFLWMSLRLCLLLYVLFLYAYIRVCACILCKSFCVCTFYLYMCLFSFISVCMYVLCMYVCVWVRLLAKEQYGVLFTHWMTFNFSLYKSQDRLKMEYYCYISTRPVQYAFCILDRVQKLLRGLMNGDLLFTL